MKGVFYCKGCNAAITAELHLQSLKDPNVPAPEEGDRQPICPTGLGYKSYEPYRPPGNSANPSPLEVAPQFWLNPDDVLRSCRLIRRPDRTQGCCGISGNGQPNLLCRNCGAELGTMQSDCWTPYIFVPHQKNMEFRKTEE